MLFPTVLHTDVLCGQRVKRRSVHLFNFPLTLQKKDNREKETQTVVISELFGRSVNNSVLATGFVEACSIQRCFIRLDLLKTDVDRD